MKVIRISEEVWDLLKKYAEPLEDNPDSVLKKILNEYIILKEIVNSNYPSKLEQIKTSENTKLALVKSGRTGKRGIPPSLFRYVEWVTYTLNSLGGRAHASEVINQIKIHFGHKFTNDEMEELNSGEIRWTKKVNWARFEMVQAGILRNDSPRGIWEIKEKSLSA
jgi:hypothetical protein